MNAVTRSFVLASALTLATAPATAAVQKIFFGEDLGQGEWTPLTAFPNAQAAEAEFLSYLVGVGTETFEGFATYALAPLALTFPGAGSATLSGFGYVYNVLPGYTNGVGRYAISGSRYWEADSSSFAVQFTSPIAAFGFYGTDIGDFWGQLTLTFTTVSGSIKNNIVNHTIGGPGGSVLFWGIIDTVDPFVSIAFGNTALGVDYFGFDNMTIGSVQQVVPPHDAPAPAPLALLAAGLVGVGFARRRT